MIEVVLFLIALGLVVILWPVIWRLVVTTIVVVGVLLFFIAVSG